MACRQVKDQLRRDREDRGSVIDGCRGALCPHNLAKCIVDEVVRLVPQERVQQIGEHLVDVPAPQLIQRNVEQVPVPHFLEETVEAVK